MCKVLNEVIFSPLLRKGSCKIGGKKAEREVFLFQKLLLVLKKKDLKRYVYKGHLLVGSVTAIVPLNTCFVNTVSPTCICLHKYNTLFLIIGCASF